MQIIYFSTTNNIHKFVQKCGISAIRGDSTLVVDEPFLLLTYTTGFGEIPKEVSSFLSNTTNSNNLKYVIGSGNKNWGSKYCAAAYSICNEHEATLLMNFELSGNVHDIKKFNKIIEEIT